MKKRISKLLLLMMVLAAAFSLTACGLDKIIERKENTKKEETSSNRKDEEKDSEEDTAGTGENKTESNTESNTGSIGGTYDTMTDYVNSSEVQNVLSSLSSQMSGSGMKIDITAEGNKMVYTYTYESLTKQDGMTESLESAVEAQDSTFQSTANSLKMVIKEANPTIEIRYVDSNGEIIYAKEYVAE